MKLTPRMLALGGAGGALATLALAVAICSGASDGEDDLGFDAFPATPEPPAFIPTTTPTVIFLDLSDTPEPGCEAQVTTENRGTQALGDGEATDIRVDVADSEGTPAAGYTVEAGITKAGVPSTASATTEAEGRITFRVLSTEPGVYTLAIAEVRDASDVRCALVGAPPLQQTWNVGDVLVEATVAPTPDTIRFQLSCHHRIPGQESDLIIRGSELVPGEEITGVLSGPGVLGDGSFGVTVDGNGSFEVRIPINLYGEYTVAIDGRGSFTYTVGDNCPG